MEKIQFDSGVKEYRINGAGVLKFNPGDPNVYARFLEAADKIQALEGKLAEQAKGLEGQENGAAVVKLMAEADKQMKEVLCWVFGQSNDFDKILGGVNLLAVAGNGERVVTNLFAALQPVLVEGAKLCAKEKSETAVRKAKQRRGEEIATPVSKEHLERMRLSAELALARNGMGCDEGAGQVRTDTDALGAAR